MSAYEGSKMQEQDERRLKYTEKEAINLAVDAMRSMGISDAHKKELDTAYRDGYIQALKDVQDKIQKIIIPL